ncbi:MAG: FAD-dependent oxidoreductase [Nitrospinota bacterium]|nr:FAD-dependent oxidoreductase [Nitrospinota bacterium]MDP6619682.1 FAD-dependent oxidoreductase [Nitrospinota bacterium]
MTSPASTNGVDGNGRMWTWTDLRDRYEVVIIGAGVHGLAAAYYLAKRGITDVAVLDKAYLGAGGSGRNTAILRSNYRTPEGSLFYEESLKLYEQMSSELDFNVMFSRQGHLTLAHNERGVAVQRERAEVNQLLGIDSRLIFPEEIAELVPGLDLSDRPRFPIQAGLYHPPGGIIRHDAVVWAYARGANRMGVGLHPFTEVTDIRVEGGAVTGVVTNRGQIKTGTVVNATAGWSSTVSRMAGVDLPIVTHPLQAYVTEPLKPWLNTVVVSGTLHVYLSQTGRGELVIGSVIDPYSSYNFSSTLPFLEQTVSHVVELFPFLTEARVMRQWTGLCDITPDFSPIIGSVDGLKGYYLDVGWGTYGFKAGPISGKMVAETIATGQVPDLIAPFGYSRFHDDLLVGERAAAATH